MRLTQFDNALIQVRNLLLQLFSEFDAELFPLRVLHGHLLHLNNDAVHFDGEWRFRHVFCSV